MAFLDRVNGPPTKRKCSPVNCYFFTLLNWVCQLGDGGGGGPVVLVGVGPIARVMLTGGGGGGGRGGGGADLRNHGRRVHRTAGGGRPELGPRTRGSRGSGGTWPPGTKKEDDTSTDFFTCDSGMEDEATQGDGMGMTQRKYKGTQSGGRQNGVKRGRSARLKRESQMEAAGVTSRHWMSFTRGGPRGRAPGR